MEPGDTAAEIDLEGAGPRDIMLCGIEFICKAGGAEFMHLERIGPVSE
jgi:hypothetical protein